MDKIDNACEKFGDIIRKSRVAILENGASLSHHHSVGKSKKEFMNQVYSEPVLDLTKSIKNSIDPYHVLVADNGPYV